MPTRIPRTGVQRRELRNGSRHPLPQRGGLKDLDLRAQPQELRLGMAVRLDRHAGQHPTVGLRLTGRRRVRDGASHQVRQPLQRRRRQPHQRLALVQPSAELPDVLIPVRRQIEPHGPVELVGQHRQLLDLADPEGSHASTGPGHQVPLAGLEDQPVRLEPPVDDLRPALVPHRDDLLPPHGVGHRGEVVGAVWRQQVIAVRYESWTQVVNRRLEPYGLVLKAGKWYLVARAGRGVRTFRVSQIQGLSVLPDQFDWPVGFDLAAYWYEHVRQFRARLHQGEALVRLSPAALERLPHLMGRAVANAAAAGEPQPDGRVLARVPIESDSHAEAELLRLGAEVEVLEPASLRERMARTVAQLAALYAGARDAGRHAS